MYILACAEKRKIKTTALLCQKFEGGMKSVYLIAHLKNLSWLFIEVERLEPKIQLPPKPDRAV